MSRDDLLRLAGRVEKRLLDPLDEDRLRLLAACFDPVWAPSPGWAGPQYLRGEVRDPHTLRALAEQVGVS